MSAETVAASGLPTGITRRGNKYWARVPGNRQKWVSDTDPIALAEWRQHYKRALAAGERLPPFPGLPGFIQAHAAYSFARYANECYWPTYLGLENLPTTTKTTKRVLDKVCAAAWARDPLTTLREPALRAWAEGVRETEAPTVAEKMCWLVWAVLNHAAHDPDVPIQGNAAANLRKRAPRGKKRRALELCELAQLAGALHTHSLLAFWLQAAAGLRIGEALGVPVRCYRPANGDGPAMLVIEQQYGKREDDAMGGQTRLPKRTKTRSSQRGIPLAPSLAAAIEGEVARRYGHSIGDPWWDLSCENPWDSAIKTNADLPIAVPNERINCSNRARRYCTDLVRAAEHLGIDVRPPGNGNRSCVSPHDLRKAFSTHLLDAKVKGPGRSVYLGHKHAAAWNEAAVTAETYSPATAKRLRKVAEASQRVLVPHLGEMRYPQPPSGDEALVTVTEGWNALGQPIPRQTFGAAVKEAGLAPRWNRWGAPGTYYTFGEVRSAVTRRTATDRLTPRECANLLGLVAKDVQRVLTREVRLGNLTRVRGSYERASAETLVGTYAAIDAGDLVAAHFLRYGDARAHCEAAGIAVVECARGAFVRADDLGKAGLARSSFTHAAAAQALGADPAGYWAMLRAFDPELALALALDIKSSLPAQALRELRSRREESVTGTGAPVIAVKPAPSTEWLSLAEAARACGSRFDAVERIWARTGWEQRVTRGEVRVRRAHAELVRLFRAGWVPLGTLALRLAVSPESAARLRDKYRWATRTAAGERLISLDSVRSTLAVLTAGEQPGLVTVAQSAALTGCTEKTVRALIARRGVSPVMAPGPSLMPARTGGSCPLYLAADLAPDRPAPEGWEPVARLTEQHGASRNQLLKAATRGAVRAVKLRGRWWADPASVVEFLAAPPAGWLPTAEAVAAAGGDEGVGGKLHALAQSGSPLARKFRSRWFFAPEAVAAACCGLGGKLGDDGERARSAAA